MPCSGQILLGMTTRERIPAFYHSSVYKGPRFMLLTSQTPFLPFDHRRGLTCRLTQGSLPILETENILQNAYARESPKCILREGSVCLPAFEAVTALSLPPPQTLLGCCERMKPVSGGMSGGMHHGWPVHWQYVHSLLSYPREIMLSWCSDHRPGPSTNLPLSLCKKSCGLLSSFHPCMHSLAPTFTGNFLGLGSDLAL